MLFGAKEDRELFVFIHEGRGVFLNHTTTLVTLSTIEPDLVWEYDDKYPVFDKYIAPSEFFMKGSDE